MKITREFVESNPKLVTMKQSVRYPDLYVVKYTNKVFYDNAWTPELMEARGLVVDKDFNVIVRPFDKIFNFMENGTTCHRDTVVEVVEKKNGFLGVMTYNEKYGWIYSTTGSLDSEYVDLAKSHLKKYEDGFMKSCDKNDLHNTSFMFEVCDLDKDPHIIQERYGEYLIGAQISNHENYSNPHLVSEFVLDVVAENMDIARPMHYAMDFGDLMKQCKTSKIEGYVIRDTVFGQPLMKIKTPYYLTCKFLGRLKNERLDDLLEDTEKFKKKLRDEEFFPLIDMIKDSYEDFTSLDEQGKIEEKIYA